MIKLYWYELGPRNDEGILAIQHPDGKIEYFASDDTWRESTWSYWLVPDFFEFIGEL